jgi:hypothetical protein
VLPPGAKIHVLNHGKDALQPDELLRAHLMDRIFMGLGAAMAGPPSPLATRHGRPPCLASGCRVSEFDRVSLTQGPLPLRRESEMPTAAGKAKAFTVCTP